MEQTNEKPTKTILNSKNIWIIVFFTIVIALIVGSGIYIWQTTNLKPTKQSSLQQISISKEDICKNKQNWEAKAICYFYQAVIIQDLTLCNNLSGDKIIDICKQRVQSVNKALSECGDNYSCYSQEGQWMAVAKQDESICNEIEDVFARADCFRNVAVVKQDPIICNEIIKLESIVSAKVLTENCYDFVDLMTD